MEPLNPMFSWLETLVPAQIRTNRSLSILHRARATAMVATLGLSILVPIITLLVLALFQFFTDRNFSQAMAIVIVVEVLLVTQHLYFQSYGNLALTARAYSLQYFFSIVATMLYTGGWYSPAMPLLLCAPMIAYMTIHYRAAMWHLFWVLCTYGALMALHTSGKKLPNIMPAETYDYILATCWGLCLLVFALFLMVCQYLEQHSVTR